MLRGPLVYEAIGAIAQLGERLICIQEVVGSIPSGSTSFIAHPKEKRVCPIAHLQLVPCSMTLLRGNTFGRDAYLYAKRAEPAFMPDRMILPDVFASNNLVFLHHVHRFSGSPETTSLPRSGH